MSRLQNFQDRSNALNLHPVCFNCGVPGHFVVACPQPSREIPAGFNVAHTQGPPSQNRQVQRRLILQHQQIYYPNQSYFPKVEATSLPFYNAPSPSILPYHYPTYNTNYQVLQSKGSPYFSGSDHVPQNHHYGPISIHSQQPFSSNYPYSTPVLNYQDSFPATQSNTLDRWSSGSSVHESSYRKSFSGLHMKRSKVRNGQKRSSEIPYNNSVGPSLFINKKGNIQNSKVCPGIKADVSEGHPHATSYQGLPTEDINYGSNMNTQNMMIQHTEFPEQNSIAESIKDDDHIEYNQDEDSWKWEFDAIFKESPAAETVELAQPLAAGFKSTPVPLVQPWSLTVPSISRYARKDNAKEFVRSIRSSPQWSFLQEDPAFSDFKLDGPLIPIDKILDWIARRRGVIDFTDKSRDDPVKTYCNKRQRLDGSEKYYQHQDNSNQVKTKIDFIGEESLQKKQKLNPPDQQNESKNIKTCSIISVPCQEEILRKESDSDDQSTKSTPKSEESLPNRETNKKVSHACEISVFAAYSRRW